MLGSDSAAISALVAGLFVICGALAFRAARRRGVRSPAAAEKASSFGSRIVFYVGAIAILGILMLFPGSTATSRLLFFAVVLPVGIWAIATDGWIEYRIIRRNRGSD